MDVPPKPAGAVPVAGRKISHPVSDGQQATPEQSQLAAELVAQRSTDSLKELLRANNSANAAESIMHIGVRQYTGTSAEKQDEVICAQEVLSFGQSMIVAMATVSGAPSQANAQYTQLLSPSEVAYIFTPDGRLAHEVGGGFYHEGLSGDSTMVLTLGAQNAWFVMTGRMVAPAPFEQTTCIYALVDDLPLALTVYHYLNDMAYTGTPTEASRSGSHLSFDGKDSKLPLGVKGTGRDGAQYDRMIFWDPKTKRFRGPALLTKDGDKVFEVDVPESKRFDPVDAPK